MPMQIGTEHLRIQSLSFVLTVFSFRRSLESASVDQQHQSRFDFTLIWTIAPHRRTGTLVAVAAMLRRTAFDVL